MSKALIVLRPEPGCSETVQAARAQGLRVVASPLFEIAPVNWDPPNPAEVDAILAGSANAFRHGGEGLTAVRGLPVQAVGERTAQAAREAGFSVAQVGAGGLQQVLDTVSGPARLLRLAGAERVAVSAPPGVSIVERIVYRSIPLELTASAAEELARGAVALLHSAAAAKSFATECERIAVDRARIHLAALGPRIAEAAGPGWAGVCVAPEMSDGALLALAADMCQ